MQPALAERMGLPECPFYAQIEFAAELAGAGEGLAETPKFCGFDETWGSRLGDDRSEPFAMCTEVRVQLGRQLLQVAAKFGEEEPAAENSSAWHRWKANQIDDEQMRGERLARWRGIVAENDPSQILTADAVTPVDALVYVGGILARLKESAAGDADVYNASLRVGGNCPQRPGSRR